MYLLILGSGQRHVGTQLDHHVVLVEQPVEHPEYRRVGERARVGEGLSPRQGQVVTLGLPGGQSPLDPPASLEEPSECIGPRFDQTRVEGGTKDADAVVLKLSRELI
jgi:hypothetical protein